MSIDLSHNISTINILDNSCRCYVQSCYKILVLTVVLLCSFSMKDATKNFYLDMSSYSKIKIFVKLIPNHFNFILTFPLFENVVYL